MICCLKLLEPKWLFLFLPERCGRGEPKEKGKEEGE